MTTIELTDDERTVLLISLGMALATEPHLTAAIRKIISKVAPTSYWGAPEVPTHDVLTDQS